jgi:hypothetical protein
MKPELANAYMSQLGYPPLMVDVGSCRVDLLPFLVSFFEAISLGEIKTEQEFDDYLRASAVMVQDVVLDVLKIQLRRVEIDYVETKLLTHLLSRLCQGSVGDA